MNEAEFHHCVEEALKERYENVEHEVVLPSNRRVDFVAESWLFTLAIEVEHHPQDVTSDVIAGAGQAFQYAAELAHERHDAGVVPVVVCNSDALDPTVPEVEGLRTRLPIVPLDPHDTHE